MAHVNKFCEPCQSENSEVLASVHCYDCKENLCDDCAKIHKKFKTSRNHKIGDLINVPYVIAEKVLEMLTTCKNHGSGCGGVAEWYCDDHDTFCCKACTDQHHKHCQKLVSNTAYISMKQNDGFRISDWQNLKSELENLEKQGIELLENEQMHAESIDKQETVLHEQLNFVKNALDSMYTQLKENIWNQFSDLKDKTLESVTSQKDSTEKLNHDVQRIKEQVALVDEHGQDIHKILLGHSLSKQNTVDVLHQTVKDLYKNITKTSLEVCLTTDLDELSKNVSELIQINITDKNIPLLLRPAEEKVPKLLASINLREKNYNDWFYPEGCLWIGDFIIVTVSGQNVLKLVNSETQTVVHTYECISEPLAICAMDHQLAGILFPKDEQIDILAIENDVLKSIKVINVGTKARDIQYNKENNSIILLCRDEGKIKFLDDAGDVTSSVDLDKKLSETVEDSLRFRLGDEGKTLYISGYCMHRLVAINMNGEVVFEYKHDNLRYPVGCDFDGEGNVFVVSWKGQAIHVVSKIGEHKRLLLEGELYYPQSICFNETRDKFAVIHTLAGSHLQIYSFTD